MMMDETKESDNIMCVKNCHEGIQKIYMAIRSWLIIKGVNQDDLEEAMTAVSLELLSIEQILESFGLITEYKEYQRQQLAALPSEE